MQVKLCQRFDRLRDDGLGDPGKVEAAKHAEERDVRKPCLGVCQNIDQAGMRARGEDDLPLADHVDRHEEQLS